jgi:catechol 2,3-dioxygenase
VGPGGAFQLASFVSCSSKPHDIAFVGGLTAGLHHICSSPTPWHDILSRRRAGWPRTRFASTWPTRHGLTRGETIYFSDRATATNLRRLATRPSLTGSVTTWTEIRRRAESSPIFGYCRACSPRSGH